MNTKKTANLRNIAIIAHVDHGKTTLVDQLLQFSGTLERKDQDASRVMDSSAQEKERGITILAKNTAINWRDYRINIVDTPGHADFGGEVERVLSMVDSVLLLVDAVDGPMPQTRFVTQKAFDRGLNPIVVINKIDRPQARPNWVIDQVFDLFDNLGATDQQLDFPIIYASALNGYASTDEAAQSGDMLPLFEAIIKYAPCPDVSSDGAFQLQVSSLDYSSYLGVMGIGRIKRGTISSNTAVEVVARDGTKRNAKIQQLFGFHGLTRKEVASATAGDIIVFTGVEPLYISDTLCAVGQADALAPLAVDEPTVTMTFGVNNSPFAGLDGKYVTSRQIKERLEQEVLHNVALRVAATDDPDKFCVSGRGELHLGVLIENMRREGFELAVSKPEVVIKEVAGKQLEPYEVLTVDVEEQHQGAVMEAIGKKRGEMQDMQHDGKGRVRIDFIIPARGLIGIQTEFMTMTSGTGLMYHSFAHYGPKVEATINQRQNGALIANGKGKALAYALYNLQERGSLLIGHGAEVYEGMVVGIHNRDNDLTVNPLRAKQLTNIRAAGSDESLILTPPINFSLEQALEFIDNDELVEVTPNHIRIRKKHLTESERKRASRVS